MLPKAAVTAEEAGAVARVMVPVLGMGREAALDMEKVMEELATEAMEEVEVAAAIGGSGRSITGKERRRAAAYRDAAADSDSSNYIDGFRQQRR